MLEKEIGFLKYYESASKRNYELSFSTAILIDKYSSLKLNLEVIKSWVCNNYTQLSNNFSLNAIQGVNLYRVVQEAINNAIKYSIASKIVLRITETTSEINIDVIDDGIGFELNKISLGNGLLNMKNRAEKINTIIRIESKPEEGTKISLTLRKDTLNVV